MKRFLVLFAFLILLSACDDGDFSVRAFDFTGATPVSCGEGADFVLYEIKGNQAMIIQINQDNFKEAITATDSPIILNIDANTKVTYRLYDGNVSQTSICDSPPAASPKVIEEWVATGGKIKISTIAIHPVDETTGANFITNFSHTINFSDIVFKNGDRTQTQNGDTLFGIYKVAATQPSTVFTTAEINDCDSNKLLFKFVGSQAITLDLSPATYAYLFENVATPTDAPRTAAISATNKLTYRVFETGLNQAYFCTSPVPATPVLRDLWTAETGDGSTTGIIEVATTSIGTSFVHTIKFRKINFVKDALSFTFGTDYLFGGYITTN